jgi:hypothetical protein
MACSSTQMIFMLVSCASSGDCRDPGSWQEAVTVPPLRFQIAVTVRLSPRHRHAGRVAPASASAQDNWPGLADGRARLLGAL